MFLNVYCFVYTLRSFLLWHLNYHFYYCILINTNENDDETTFIRCRNLYYISSLTKESALLINENFVKREIFIELQKSEQPSGINLTAITVKQKYCF